MIFPRKSVIILVVMILFCFSYPFLSPFEADAFDKNAILLSPSLIHPFGTDVLGRDVLTRTALAGQNSFIIGVGGSLLATLLGFIIGVSAALFGSKADKIVVILIDLFLAFPTLFLLFTLVSIVNASLGILIFIIAVSGWMGTARLIRSETYTFIHKPYICAFQLGRVSEGIIMMKYLLPLLFPLIGINFTLGVSGAILAESALSFLGLGIMPPEISWGTLLGEGKSVLDVGWWISFFPGLFLFTVTATSVFIGNGLQQLTYEKDIASTS